MAISPDFEVILCSPNESFRWNVHDYPHQLAKWHYHPEYELHLVRETSGQMRIGDFVGAFQPGNLVFTGPYVPHHWVSSLPAGTVVRNRDMVIQFTREFATQISCYPELHRVEQLLVDARHGVEFLGKTAQVGAELLHEIGRARGLRRLTRLLELMELLSEEAAERKILSQSEAASEADTKNVRRIRYAVSHIHRNYTQELRLGDLAEIANMEPSTFSRFFKKQTGFTFASFVTRLRVHHACRLLVNSQRSITDICYDSGFNNTANFNRQFLAVCGETPTGYRNIAQSIAHYGGADRSEHEVGEPVPVQESLRTSLI